MRGRKKNDEKKAHVKSARQHYTRDVEAFLKKTAIAYHQNSAFLLGFGRYAIAVFFKNASTSRAISIARWLTLADRTSSEIRSYMTGGKSLAMID